MNNLMLLSQMTEAILTDVDKAKIRNDFKEWSGGFAPEEAGLKEQETYLKATLPIQYKGREKEVRAWFAEMTSGLESNPNWTNKADMFYKLIAEKIINDWKSFEFKDQKSIKEWALKRENVGDIVYTQDNKDNRLWLMSFRRNATDLESKTLNLGIFKIETETK